MKDFLIIFFIISLITLSIIGLFNPIEVKLANSGERFKIVETNIEWGWTYYKDIKFENVCFISRKQEGFFAIFPIISNQVSYVPCDQLK